MYKELVKELLKKHFGQPKSSLTLGETDVSDEKLYLYCLENEKEITSLCDLLNMKHLVEGIEKVPELNQIFSESDECSKISQCIYFSESNENWTIRFHEITGVRYHRTYGNRTVATLQTDRLPFVTLSDRDDEFFGFWRKYISRKKTPYTERDGLSYWMNKALKTNGQFRSFAVDFFFAVAEAEKLHILKDVARAISNCGCFLPPVSFQKLVEYRTPAELIKDFEEEPTDLNVDFNKVDINVGFVMSQIAPKVQKRDWKLISKLTPEKVSDAASLKLFYDGFSAEEFIRWYYRKEFKGRAPDEDIRMYAEDYVAMCLEAGEKFRLNYGLDALIRAHDELSIKNRMKANKEEFEKPLLAVPSKFDNLETAIKNTGSTEFERIITARRLFEEGEYQHNCVFSRRGLVRRDRASIYHWNHEGLSYTIQFARDRSGNYFLYEIRARFNNSVTTEHLDYLKTLLKGICKIDDGVVGGLFQNRNLQLHFEGWDEIDAQEALFDLPF